MQLLCPFCSGLKNKGPVFGHNIVRSGRFFRSSDRMDIQRFYCKTCLKHFSQATNDPCFSQKKRQMNEPVSVQLCAGVSLRETARILRLNYKTVVRKRKFMASQARFWMEEFVKGLRVTQMQFDDMETFEHSKLKPLSITLAVQKSTRFILGTRVSMMPAKGLLVAASLKKYGPRRDERKRNRRDLFKSLIPIVDPFVEIESDQNPHYEPDVRRFFPQAQYVQFKGRRGCVVGQGELKGGGWDPLFSLNHTCAMLRANINRLFRRTWCTTKKPECLEEHLWLYFKSHNQRIFKKLSEKGLLQSYTNPIQAIA